MLVEEVPRRPQSGNDPATQALAQENEVLYFARVYGEYVAALKSQSKPTAGITVQAFTTKLRLVEGGLKQKWKCRSVRFASCQGDLVTLKPVPIY